MAGQTVVVSVLADTKKFSSAMRNLGDTSGLNKLGGAVRTVGKAVAGGALAVGAAAVAWAGDTAKALMNVERIGAQTDAVIKSTGGAAGKTRADIDGLADSIEKMSGVEAETVAQGENLLLTFTNIKGQNFDRATQAMTDMGVAMNGGSLAGLDLSSSAVQLGKALNDPIKGVTALSKVGVSFTQQQKDQIAAMVEAGDVAGAQTLILDELAKEFGGSAEAAGSTVEGTWAKIKNAFGAVSEEVLAFLLPALRSVAEWALNEGIPRFKAFTDWVAQNIVPALKDFGTWAGDNLVPKLKDLGGALADVGGWIMDTVVPALISLGEWVVKNKDWLVAIAVAVGAFLAIVKTFAIINAAVTAFQALRAALAAGTIAQWAMNAAMLANPITLIIAAIVALVAGLVWFFTQTETGRAIWDSVWSGIKAAVDFVVDWWNGTVVPWWNRSVEDFKAKVNAIKAAWDIAWNAVRAIFQAVIQVITTIITTYVNMWRNAFQTAWNAIQNVVQTVIGAVRGIIDTAMNSIRNIISGVLNIVKGLFTGNFDQIKQGVGQALGGVIGFVRDIPAQALSALGNIGRTLWNAGKSLIQGFIDGIGNMVGNVRKTLSDLTSKLTSWKGPEDRDKTLLTNAGELVIQGFINGLERQYTNVRKSLGGLTEMVANTSVPDIEGTVTYSPDTSRLDTAAALNPTRLDTSAGVITGGATYNINVTVTGVLDGYDAGRKIQAALDEWKRMNGANR